MLLVRLKNNNISINKKVLNVITFNSLFSCFLFILRCFNLQFFR